MNDKTLKCIILPANPLVAARGVSREIGDIHANALCEKYGNNIAEAKQNSLPLHMKYTQDRGVPATAVLLFFLFISPLLRRPRVRGRVYSFSFFKAPHLPRSRERAPDPTDDAD